MRDPHVESLHYTLDTSYSLKFSNPPPIEGDQPEFKFKLEGDRLTATMKGHFAAAAEARIRVEPFLRAWELDDAVRQGRQQITFKYDKPTMIDRDPPKPGEPQIIHVEGIAQREYRWISDADLDAPTYPAVPTRFKASPDVETLWFRYQQFLEGKEPLLSMAYACLTMIEGSTGVPRGARGVAVTQYAIDRDVLDRIGDWVSTKGGVKDARKLGGTATLVPLTSAEEKWVKAAIRMLIRRKAEFDADPAAAFSQITMADVQ